MQKLDDSLVSVTYLQKSMIGVRDYACKLGEWIVANKKRSEDAVTVLRYDGEALADHEIGAQELASALLGLTDLVHSVNQRYNGDRATLRITVKANIEQHCFEMAVHAVLHWLDQAKGLFDSDHYKSAREILAIVGIGGGITAGGAKSILWLWKKLYGEKGSPPVTVSQSGGVTIIVQGDGNTINVPSEIYALATDPAIADMGRKMMKPLEKKGYESVSFHEADETTISLNKQNAQAFIASAPTAKGKVEVRSDDVGAHPYEGPIEITTAQYRGNAQWGFRWLGKSFHMKIADDEWLNRFQDGKEPDAMPGAYLDVKMTIHQATPKDLPIFIIHQVKGVLRPEPDNTDIFSGQ